jgi:hypothetical protein
MYVSSKVICLALNCATTCEVNVFVQILRVYIYWGSTRIRKGAFRIRRIEFIVV